MRRVKQSLSNSEALSITCKIPSFVQNELSLMSTQEWMSKEISKEWVISIKCIIYYFIKKKDFKNKWGFLYFWKISVIVKIKIYFVLTVLILSTLNQYQLSFCDCRMLSGSFIYNHSPKQEPNATQSSYKERNAYYWLNFVFWDTYLSVP